MNQSPSQSLAIAWTTIMRFDSPGIPMRRMAAPERSEMLRGSKHFIEPEHFIHLGTSFAGWVPVDPAGKGSPKGENPLLVLPGLFPIVMLEMIFPNTIMAKQGFHASLAMFIGNAISVFLTSVATMPLFLILFGWWLFPKVRDAAVELEGGSILAVTVFRNLLPW